MMAASLPDGEGDSLVDKLLGQGADVGIKSMFYSACEKGDLN